MTRDDGWTMKSWDRMLGRGVIVSAVVGELPFDGSVAAVADFVVGERVEVTLAPAGRAYRVVRVWPDDPRFTLPATVAAQPPPLRAELAETVAETLRSTSSALDYRALGDGEDLIVQGDHAAFAYGHDIELRFHAVGYVELPAWWPGKSMRLANEVERAYLASRSELDDATIAVRIVDDERRIYFVTCAGLSAKLLRG